jgi:uncharacterized membrane protein
LPRIRKSIEIEASPENVFNYVANPATMPDWVNFIREAEVVSGDGKSKGTTDRTVFKLGPRAQTVEALWAEYDPPNTFVRRHTSGLDLENRISLSPSDGATRVEWAIAYRPPMGPVGALFDVLFMNRVFQNEMEESLESLKAQLEG